METDPSFWHIPIPSLTSWQMKGPDWREKLQHGLLYIWALNEWHYGQRWTVERAAQAVGLKLAELYEALPHLVERYRDITLHCLVAEGLARMRLEGATATEVGFPSYPPKEYLRDKSPRERTKRRPA